MNSLEIISLVISIAETKESALQTRKYDAATKKIYKAMECKFRRAKVAKSGVLASFYLDVFCFKSMEIRANHVQDLGLCKAGEFTKVWLEKQKKLGYLIVTVSDNRGHPVYSFKPGTKIVSYINQFTMLTEQVVGRTEFENLEQKVDSLLNYFIEEFDPPYTEEKGALYTKRAHLKLVGKPTNVSPKRKSLKK